MERLAVSMWDFSWLQRRWDPEDEYQNPAKVLDELAERGYNCVRIDAFPHLIAPAKDGTVQQSFVVHPQDDTFMWGRHQPTKVEPRSNLVEFVRLAAERDIRVALSSWFNDDDTHRLNEIETPEDYVRVWAPTLELLDDEGLLTNVAWVDLCNEFPMEHWAPEVNRRIFGVSNRGSDGTDREWSADESAGVEEYLHVVNDLRQRWPHLRYTYSVIIRSPSYYGLDYSSLDVLEPHIWLTEAAKEFNELTDFDGIATGGLQRHINLVQQHYWSRREEWLAQLDAEMDRWAKVARQSEADLITTEGWSSIFWDTMPTADGRPCWDFVKDVAEFAVERAIEKGWYGICTSNFSQPHFTEFWADVAWHQKLTSQIKRLA